MRNELGELRDEFAWMAEEQVYYKNHEQPFIEQINQSSTKKQKSTNLLVFWWSGRSLDHLITPYLPT
ncbi:MAG: hypothetical protein WAT37_11560 [Saprospiraceae bacterium]